ncbi:MAG: FkbM family methyltransferase [Proteobacteria bacterium]|nr:FkbM family methyltransferase [Pseudomonadota bacterium]
MKIFKRTPSWRRAVRKCGRLLFDLAENNGAWDIAQNGELWLISALLASRARRDPLSTFAVMDVGANVGDYTATVLREADRRRRAVTVCALEPAARSAERLRARFADEPRVTVVEAAAGRQTGLGKLYGGDSGGSQASLISREVLAGSGMVEVAVVRLDDCLREKSIGRVDLLKLDVEGFELEALEGLGSQLRPDVVDVIQFEYGGTTLDAGVTLRDLYGLLSRAGYLIGKLLPNAIDVRPYDCGMEHFSYSNFVALSRVWLERAP